MFVLTEKNDIAAFARHHEICLALGYFDGLHLGHQALLERALQLTKEHGGDPCVLLLEPHPQIALKGTGALRILNPLDEKIRLIQSYGDFHILILSFDSVFAAMAPETFVQDYLIDLLRIKTAIR